MDWSAAGFVMWSAAVVASACVCVRMWRHGREITWRSHAALLALQVPVVAGNWLWHGGMWWVALAIHLAAMIAMGLTTYWRWIADYERDEAARMRREVER